MSNKWKKKKKKGKKRGKKKKRENERDGGLGRNTSLDFGGPLSGNTHSQPGPGDGKRQKKKKKKSVPSVSRPPRHFQWFSFSFRSPLRPSVFSARVFLSGETASI
jgi:hypothetical protein